MNLLTGGEFQTNITRFTLPIRSLDFNKSGSMLAAAGDDDGIKLINTVDGSIARVLKGHKGSICGLAFDPIGEYLASVDSIGTAIIWELNSGRTLHVLLGVAPDIRSDVSCINALSWSPDAEILAVPGLKNDVVMYDRDTAEKLFSLGGDHAEPICFLSWSPNGKYMATSDFDKQVLIWDVDRRQDIDRMKFNDRICCMAWKPIGNALAVIDIMGKYGVWNSPVTSSMKSPTEDLPQSKNSNGLLLFDEEDKEPSASGSESDLGEHSHSESEPPTQKLLEEPVLAEYLGDDDHLTFSRTVGSNKRAPRGQNEKLNSSKDKAQIVAITAKPYMQEAFQSGATPMQAGKRHFLCYNMLGIITTMEHDGYHHIEVTLTRVDIIWWLKPYFTLYIFE